MMEDAGSYEEYREAVRVQRERDRARWEGTYAGGGDVVYDMRSGLAASLAPEGSGGFVVPPELVDELNQPVIEATVVWRTFVASREELERAIVTGRIPFGELIWQVRDGEVAVDGSTR